MLLDIRKKSPKATIGNSKRFPKTNSLNDFVGNLPEQYVKNASKMQAKPIPLGTFTNAKRWNEATISPGVGDYDLTGFKNFAKASETQFEIPQKLTGIAGSGEKRARAKSAFQRSDIRTDKS